MLGVVVAFAVALTAATFLRLGLEIATRPGGGGGAGRKIGRALASEIVRRADAR